MIEELEQQQGKTYYLLCKFNTSKPLSKVQTEAAIKRALNETDKDSISMRLFELGELLD